MRCVQQRYRYIEPTHDLNNENSHLYTAAAAPAIDDTLEENRKKSQQRQGEEAKAARKLNHRVHMYIRIGASRFPLPRVVCIIRI